jgi:hypothetical protein
VVQTKVDETWGSVKSIGEIQDELSNIKQQIIDLLQAGKPLDDPTVQKLSSSLGEINTNDVSKWDSDVRTPVSDDIITIQNALTCSAPSRNLRALCSAENALSILMGADLKGYELVLEMFDIKNKLVDTKCSKNNYQWCYDDKPKLLDDRFDLIGKTNLGICLLLGEEKNFTVYSKIPGFYSLDLMADNFKRKTGMTIDLTGISDVKKRVEESTQMKAFSDIFTNMIKAKILQNKINEIDIDYILSNNDVKNPSFNIIRNFIFPTSAYVAIGGTQAFELNFTILKKKGTATTDLSTYIIEYQFTFWDTYGADFADINFTA